MKIDLLSSLILPKEIKRVLVTGGAGFIGGTLIRHLLLKSNVQVFNIDKISYASDLTSIEITKRKLNNHQVDRHQLLKIDLCNKQNTQEAIEIANPDLVFHLAAESHVDRSIEGPEAFINSNIIGTFNLLQAVLNHWENLPTERKERFRLHHISTDEVFGSLSSHGRFCEQTAYNPRSPYSASKAASDHLVRSWYHTYGLPTVLSNCSNNFGPWQFPEKLIPMVIIKALKQKSIPLYGDGENIRDWLFVDDHIEALLLTATKGQIGESYCIGGHGEKSNLIVVEGICKLMDRFIPVGAPHNKLIQKVADRPGHDRRYAIDPSRITRELGWQPMHSFETGLEKTVIWYLKNTEWCNKVLAKGRYDGGRIGLIKS